MATGALLATAGGSWRAERPVLGGVLLMIAGLIVGYVPIQFTFELILIGGAFTAIGLVFAVLIFLTGVFALLRPDLSTILGIAGVAFSILSVVGALGGLLVGLLIGIVGSNLLIAWQPPGDPDDYTATATTTTPAGASGGDFGWQEGASTGAGVGTTAPTTTGTTGGDFDWQDETGGQPASTGQSGTGAGTGTGTGAATGTGAGGGTADAPFDDPTGTGATGGSDSDSQFSWQDDPDAQTGTGGEDVGVEFDAERQPTMDDDEEEDDDRMRFDWENES